MLTRENCKYLNLNLKLHLRLSLKIAEMWDKRTERRSWVTQFAAWYDYRDADTTGRKI